MEKEKKTPKNIYVCGICTANRKEKNEKVFVKKSDVTKTLGHPVKAPYVYKSCRVKDKNGKDTLQKNAYVRACPACLKKFAIPVVVEIED